MFMRQIIRQIIITANCFPALFLQVQAQSSLPVSDKSFSTSTEYRLEAFGSAASGLNTPFWMVSNRYGIVPLLSENGYMRTAAMYNILYNNNIRIQAGLDLVASAPRYRNFYAQQLYAEISYKFLNMRIGSKENYTSLFDRDLSSGDMVMSANAMPIPEINLSVPQFTVIPYTKGWLQFRGDFAVGRSYDNTYLEKTAGAKQHYVKNMLWHHKSLHIRLSDTRDDFPFSAVIGIRHSAQWGGISTNDEFGAQPQAFSDFIRIFFGKGGGSNAFESEQINVLGNHYGSYDFKFGYLNPKFDIYLYKQHFFDDASGMEMYNYPDGLYGLQVNPKNFSWIDKIVVEYLNTTNQSGPVHFIAYDHDRYPGYGGGADNYYNNEIYFQGVSYFGRNLGAPLVLSTEYNRNGRIDYSNTRLRAYHLGISGLLSKQIAYRLLTTSSANFGTTSRPFLSRKDAFSCAFRISYCHPRLEGWLFSTEAAHDSGGLTGKSTGISLSISKSGIVSN